MDVMKKQDKSPASSTPCVCFNLRKASRVVSQFYDQYLRQAGMRGTQYALLAHVDGRGGVSITELGDLLGMEHSTVTRNVELLAAKGQVSVSVSPDDARRRMVDLTPAGRDSLDRARPYWLQAQSTMEERLGAEESAVFIRTLNRLVEAVR